MWPIATRVTRSMVYVSVCLCARQRALYKNGRTDREPVWQADFGRPKEPRIRWGPHGLHLANTSKRSVRGGDADLRQVTLTIFSVPTLTRSRNYC